MIDILQNLKFIYSKIQAASMEYHMNVCETKESYVNIEVADTPIKAQGLKLKSITMYHKIFRCHEIMIQENQSYALFNIKGYSKHILS